MFFYYTCSRVIIANFAKMYLFQYIYSMYFIIYHIFSFLRYWFILHWYASLLFILSSLYIVKRVHKTLIITALRRQPLKSTTVYYQTIRKQNVDFYRV